MEEPISELLLAVPGSNPPTASGIIDWRAVRLLRSHAAIGGSYFRSAYRKDRSCLFYSGHLETQTQLPVSRTLSPEPKPGDRSRKGEYATDIVGNGKC